jgi:hypothetical protein
MEPRLPPDAVQDDFGEAVSHQPSAFSRRARFDAPLTIPPVRVAGIAQRITIRPWPRFAKSDPAIDPLEDCSLQDEAGPRMHSWQQRAATHTAPSLLQRLKQRVSQQTDKESRRDVPMLGVMRRMIYSLALIPIVPAVAYVAVSCCKDYLLPSDADEYRWFDLFFSSLMVLCMILIWRTVIVWTLGRKMLTALVSMIPFVQVIYAKPLWDAGCVLRELLRFGQEQFGIAVWIWILIWVWWAYERLTDSGGTTPSRPWRMRPIVQVSSSATVGIRLMAIPLSRIETPPMRLCFWRSPSHLSG